MGGARRAHVDDEKYKILVGKPEGRTPLRKPKRT